MLICGYIQGIKGKSNVISFIGVVYQTFLRLGNTENHFGGVVSGRIFSLTVCFFPIVVWAYYEGIFTAFLTINILSFPRTFDEALVLF